MTDPAPAFSIAPATAELRRQARHNLVILSIVTVVIAVLIATNFGGFCRNLLMDAIPRHLSFAFLVILFFVVVMRPTYREQVLLLAAIGVALIFHATGTLTSAQAQVAIGLALLAIMLPCAFLEDGGFARFWFIVSAAPIVPAAYTLALVGQQLTVFHRATFDTAAYVTDSAYGFIASAILGKILWASPLLHYWFGMVYGWLLVAVAICYALGVRAGNRDAGVVLNASLAGGAIAFCLYHLYPAAGPLYAFGPAFPGALPDPSTLSLAPTGLALPGAARNCMPSVHFFCALLAAVEARRLARGWQIVFALFAVLTAITTIAVGEHYLIDLVAAVPFTLSLHAVCSRRAGAVLGWRFAAAFGALATLGWIAMLRLLPAWTARPPVLWALTLTTLLGSAAAVVAYLADRQPSWAGRIFGIAAPAFAQPTPAGRSVPAHPFAEPGLTHPQD